ncbi:response regulator transcription factor [Rubrivirga sp.]|uniref:response regulator transcription factor n=1 Tax=Rubrivirga sp. TaxID=1885344 RepID=UPI003B519919
MTDAARVLLVEDDGDLADLLGLHLREAGYAVEAVADGALALQRALADPYDLVLLDLMLPGMGGMEVCRQLRAAGRTVPVLMLTARGGETDRVLGLETGADDYVPKPFSVREVLARVGALLRRVDYDRPPADPDEALRFGTLAVFPQRARVEVDGQAVDVTKKELELLVLFARHPGRAFSRQELLDKVWGVQFAGYAHTVNTHINRLRAKVEPDPASPVFVQTVWGVGYRFAEPSEIDA